MNKSVVIKLNMDKYQDIINLPHHVSLNHKHMSNYDRAAQFAPFAALTGYDALIMEMARETKQKLTISSDKAEEISEKLRYIKEHIKDSVKVTIIYFKKDKKKDGGEYLTIKDSVLFIDEYHKTIKVGEETIKFNDVYDIIIDKYDNFFDC